MAPKKPTLADAMQEWETRGKSAVLSHPAPVNSDEDAAKTSFGVAKPLGDRRRRPRNQAASQSTAVASPLAAIDSDDNMADENYDAVKPRASTRRRTSAEMAQLQSSAHASHSVAIDADDEMADPDYRAAKSPARPSRSSSFRRGSAQSSTRFATPEASDNANNANDALRPLFFVDMQHAETSQDARIPLRRVKAQNGGFVPNGVEEVLANQLQYVEAIRDALNEPVPSMPQSVCLRWDADDEVLREQWNRWQNEHAQDHSPKAASAITGWRKFVEKRVWELLKEVIAVHRYGAVEGVETSSTLSCPGRIEAIVGVIRDFTSVRADFTNPTGRISLQSLAADPSAYALRRFDEFAEAQSAMTSAVEGEQADGPQHPKDLYEPKGGYPAVVHARTSVEAMNNGTEKRVASSTLTSEQAKKARKAEKKARQREDKKRRRTAEMDGSQDEFVLGSIEAQGRDGAGDERRGRRDSVKPTTSSGHRSNTTLASPAAKRTQTPGNRPGTRSHSRQAEIDRKALPDEEQPVVVPPKDQFEAYKQTQEKARAQARREVEEARAEAERLRLFAVQNPVVPKLKIHHSGKKEEKKKGKNKEVKKGF